MNFAFKKPFSFHPANQVKSRIIESSVTTPISPEDSITEIQDPNKKREQMMREAELSRK